MSDTNTQETLEQAWAEVNELRKLYQQGVKANTELHRELTVGLAEIKKLQEEIVRFTDILKEANDSFEEDEE